MPRPEDGVQFQKKCCDCGLVYSSGEEILTLVQVIGVGLLCFNCIAAHCVEIGLENVTLNIRSGVFNPTTVAEIPAKTQSVDCRSEDGQTVGMIDTAILMLQLLQNRNLSSAPVVEALRDLKAQYKEFADAIPCCV